MEEIWKDIPNYNGYQVSNLGRVRTFNKTTYTKKHGVRHWKNRILKFKGETYDTGYRVDLWKDGKAKSFLVARLVAFTFNDVDINNHNLTVDHLDCNRFNNNINNLELVSLQENIKRAYDNDLTPSIKIKIIDKKNNKETNFRSLAKGNIYINQNHCYLSEKIKKNIYENELYRWELI